VRGNEGGRGTISFTKSDEAASCEAASSQDRHYRLMLDNEEIRGCLRYAEECARKAKEASKPKLRENFLEMERRWLRLAHSYEFAKKLKNFRNPQL
jgi:hypothetical protein